MTVSSRGLMSVFLPELDASLRVDHRADHEPWPVEVAHVDESVAVQPETWWMPLGLCRGADPDLFFPSHGTNADTAKRICGECPVRSECLEYALAHRERFGVWGGKSERERRRLRRARVAA